MTTLHELQQQADTGFTGVGGWRYEELAVISRSLGSMKADARYFIPTECFELTASRWGGGDGGAVTQRYAAALANTWDHHLQAILGEDDVAAGVALAETLRDDLLALAVHDPLTY